VSSALLTRPRTGEEELATTVLAHLDAQIASARSLLAVVLEQGAAIRDRDVQGVVRLSGMLRGEMGRRQLLDEQRTRLLARCGERLGVAGESVTLTGLLALMRPDQAERARMLSAELKGLLAELQREHTCNRAIMQIELGFLEHLMSSMAIDGVNGYDTRGSATPITRARPHGSLHVLDLSA
jgi:FlgN protein